MTVPGTTTTVTVVSTYPYVSRHWVKPKAESFRGGALRIYTDGKNRGYVSALGRRELAVAPGTHRVRVCFRWFRSRPVVVEVDEGQNVELNASVPRTVSGAIRLLLLPWRALDLEPTR